MRVGVIASMKRGLEHFVYRELRIFDKSGVKISLFPTKYKKDHYNAHDNWELNNWRALNVVLKQPFYFLRKPTLYIKILRVALKYGELVDFMLAWHFSDSMKKVDIIYSTFGDHKLFIGYFSKLIFNKPLVTMVHAYEFYINPNEALFVTALDACDQIITVTEYNRELLKNKFKVDPSRVEVVRISVDLEDYKLEQKFTILIVAFFGERKGHEVLFKAIKKLNMPDLEVWVVGDKGTTGNTVDAHQLAKDIGVEDQVAFFGKLSGSALKAMYRHCDIFCLPSHHDSQGTAEGFPTVIAEAMAFGKPVVSTRHVEIPNILNRVLVDEKDVDGLADAILQVYSSEDLRRETGEENKELAHKYFGSNAEKTVAILSEVASRKK
ncbi:MAG: glycosyltransferase family 4 protein [Aggregatilineales bacterium]